MKNGEIIENVNFQGDYCHVKFFVPEICRTARAGHFVHVRIDNGIERILRRPFSIHDVDTEKGVLSVVYKIVGGGTEKLAAMKPGECCDLMGPLGNPFSLPAADEIPVLAAGGYGAAALYLLTRDSAQKGVFLMGARSAGDIILSERYREAGFDVRLATNDGSLGHKGFVTELFDGVLSEYAGKKLRFYGCGPTPMLLAMADYLQKNSIPGEVSLDHVMCCGVGACFGCVIKVKDDNSGVPGQNWRYARTCSEGPVFDAKAVYCGV